MSIFRRPHRRHKAYTRKLSPLAIALICVAATLVVSLVTGLLLRTFMDEDTYNRLNKPNRQTVTNPVNTYLPDIKALPFSFSTATDTIEASASRALFINSPDGTVSYTSPVTLYLGMTANPNITLERDLIALDLATSYISGVFHPQAFLQETADLSFAVASQERALLREFVKNGGNEVLLVIDSLQIDTLSVITDYVGALKSDLGSTALGVAVSHDLAISEHGWEIISSLLRVADFCALDLRLTEAENKDEAADVLYSLDYYLKQYDMRLLLSENRTALIDALSDSDISDYEILAAPATDAPEEPPITEQ